MEPTMARRLWHVVRAVLYMLRKGMSKRKLAMDLHLLLRRSKIAGKALGNLMTFHGHHHRDGHVASAAANVPPFSCRAMDPTLAVCNTSSSREVEFSCSNTPSYPALHLPHKRRRRNHRHHHGDGGGELGYYNYDAADIAKVFEMLNDEDLRNDGEAPSSVVAATTSPALWIADCAPVRQLRITDSPFPAREDEPAEDGSQVDLRAEEFIRQFYEQLRVQQFVATPDYSYHSTYEHARPVAAGVA